MAREWLERLRADRMDMGPLPPLGQRDYWRFQDKCTTKAKVDLAAFSETYSASAIDMARVYNALIDIACADKAFRIGRPQTPPMAHGFVVRDERGREVALRSIYKDKAWDISIWLHGVNEYEGAIAVAIMPTELPVIQSRRYRAGMAEGACCTPNDALWLTDEGGPIEVLRLATCGLLSAVRGEPLDPALLPGNLIKFSDEEGV